MFVQDYALVYYYCIASSNISLFPFLYSDLKPANIGFDEKGTVKIFDFGLSREYEEDKEGRPPAKPHLMTGGAGTPRYMAPEVARMDDSYGFAAFVHYVTVADYDQQGSLCQDYIPDRLQGEGS
jgi:serine/threonine protein kinase